RPAERLDPRRWCSRSTPWLALHRSVEDRGRRLDVDAGALRVADQRHPDDGARPAIEERDVSVARRDVAAAPAGPGVDLEPVLGDVRGIAYPRRHGAALRRTDRADVERRQRRGL